jgi:hypothetical protein
MTDPAADRPERFAISYDPPSRLLLTAMGLGPRFSGVRVTTDVVEVRMGWAFRARIARSGVHDVHRSRRPVLSRGVHGWAGRWLVNGSSRGLVRVPVRPPATALVCGLRVRLTELAVSLEHPDRFLSALGEAARP